MKNCVLCDIVKDINNKEQCQTVILYEHDLIIIVPTKGALSLDI